jgi:hypothetical protein
VVRIGADRGVNTRCVRELRWGVPRSQDGKERDGSKHGSNPYRSVTTAPEMPIKRHLPHLTTMMIVQRFWLPNSIF